MSTNAFVYIRLKEEDRNKVLKFNPNLVHEVDIDSGNVKREIKPKESTVILGAYVNWDGDDIIDSLNEFFYEYDKALNLILGGAMSYIQGENVRYYSSWRDEEYEIVEKKENESLEMRFIEYIYLFEDEEWKTIDNADFLTKN